MDENSGFLKQAATPVDPARLEELGKQAAMLADAYQMTVQDACVDKLSGLDLTSEQVRRVVEAANVEAFQRKYATMDPCNRVVDFDGGPADPMQVLQTLNNAARPTPKVAHVWDYDLAPDADTPPSPTKLSDVPVVDRTVDGVLQDVSNLRSKLAGAHTEVVDSRAAAALQMEEVLGGLGDKVKSASAEGLALDDLVAAWSKVNPVLVKVALSGMPPLPRRTEKVAQYINPEHPVVTMYETFCKHAQDYYRMDGARRELEQKMLEVDEFLMKHASGKDNAARAAGQMTAKAIKGTKKGLKALYQSAGEFGEEVARSLGKDPKAGRKAGKAVLVGGSTVAAAKTPVGEDFRRKHNILPSNPGYY